MIEDICKARSGPRVRVHFVPHTNRQVIKLSLHFIPQTNRQVIKLSLHFIPHTNRQVIKLGLHFIPQTNRQVIKLSLHFIPHTNRQVIKLSLHFLPSTNEQTSDQVEFTLHSTNEQTSDQVEFNTAPLLSPPFILQNDLCLFMPAKINHRKNLVHTYVILNQIYQFSESTTVFINFTYINMTFSIFIARYFLLYFSL